MNGTCTLLKLWVKRTGLSEGLAAQSILFFVLAFTATIFAIGSDPSLIMQVAPGVLWVLVLLSSLLGLPDLLERDAQDGTLDDMVLSAHSLPMLMTLKGMAHWIATGLPLSLIAPIIIYVMDGEQLFDPLFILIGLMAGSLYFSAIGLMASAIVLQARRTFALYAAIVLPLSLPGLIFGAGAFAAVPMGLDNRPGFYLLAACTAAACTLSPFAAAWIVRMKVRS